MNVGALVLAAGKGTRMHADIPKVLQPLLGEPMLYYVLHALTEAGKLPVWAVIGHAADAVRRVFPAYGECFILQEPQLGTGDAVRVALPHIRQSGVNAIIVVNGDCPLLSGSLLKEFLQKMVCSQAAVGLATLFLEDPGSYGRIIRDGDGKIQKIVECKDFDPVLHGCGSGEINAGLYYFSLRELDGLLPRLTNANRSGEFYLTDCIALAAQAGMRVEAVNFGAQKALMGVNTPVELAEAETVLRDEINRRWLERGVRLHLPQLVTIGPRARIEPGVSVSGPSEILGDTLLKTGCCIESHCVVRNVEIGEKSIIHSFSHLEDARIGKGCVVGPYARMRPASRMEDGAKIGNFVEMKKAVLRQGAKASHLTYLGDADIGARANIGAGTITCNYDGKNKYQTYIGEDAFVGSNTALVAPVTVGSRALIGAGSVITKDVPDNTLAITRAPQKMFARKKSGEPNG